MRNIILRLSLWLLPIVMVILQPCVLYSQETDSCAVKLKIAQSNFTKGQVDQIPELLTGCLRSGFKKEDALSAFKLLIQTYLLDDKVDQADSAMLAFLKEYPEYKISPTDHSSFVYLFNKFEVKPVMMVSIRAGTSYPFMTFLNERVTSGNPGKSSFKTNFANLYLSADARMKLTERLEGAIEIGYSQLQFTNIVEVRNMDDLVIEEIQYIENQKRLLIPVSLCYDFKSYGKFTPYARIGIGAAVNLSVNADASVVALDRFSADRTGETLDRKDSRATLDLVVIAGGGIKYKIPRGWFFAELRAGLGTLNQYLAGGATEPVLENYYKWRDPDFRFNALNFNIGWTYIFYKPSKRKV